MNDILLAALHELGPVPFLLLGAEVVVAVVLIIHHRTRGRHE